MSLNDDDLNMEEEENNEQKRQILINTDIREVIHKILAFQHANSEEIYFLKHEGLWVLIIMSLASEEVTQLLLQEVEMSEE